MADQGAGTIHVVGARTHNLDSVTVDVPKGVIVAFTGVSGSGKTSLLLDTIHAEAQLRYLEGITPFVRQFITPKDRPLVDRIDGLPPTLAVDQRRLNRSEQSTLATITATNDYLGLAFSRIPPLGADWDTTLGSRLTPAQFNPATPDGACPACHGSGGTVAADESLVITDPDRPLLAGASPWFERVHSTEQSAMPSLARHYGVSLDTPWRDLPPEFRQAVLHGTGGEPIEIAFDGTFRKSGASVSVRTSQPVRGLLADIERLYAAAGTGSAKQRYRRFMRHTPCPDCEGTGAGRVARTVTIGGLRYAEVLRLPVGQVREWAHQLPEDLNAAQREAAQALLPGLLGRLRLLGRLGLDHVQLERSAPSMSGGELQRARVAAQLSTALNGIAFVLDEPSSGLHPADKLELAKVLDDLRAGGNTVLLVEHDPDIIRRADWIIDLGPRAGREGGQVVACGTSADVAATPGSLTGAYLAGHGPRVRRQRPGRAGGWVTLEDIRVRTLDIDRVRVMRAGLTCFTGVSGSGKSTLLNEVLAAQVQAQLDGSAASDGQARISGLDGIGWITIADQNPIGRNPRSTPATYSKTFDAVRALFAATQAARNRSLTASAFSFNSAGGRCETCAGYGTRQVDMHFLPDVWVTCEACQGRRFGPDVLSVTYRGLAIDRVLALTVDEAAEVFDTPSVRTPLVAMQKAGLGYLALGQSSTELSGGEAQRLKLAMAINRGTQRPGLVVLDEPVTGLHPADVQRMLDAFESLLAVGNTVVVAEHDLHLAAAADWVVDLGPGAGRDGGRVVNEGTPAEVAAGTGPTAQYLRPLMPPAGG